MVLMTNTEESRRRVFGVGVVATGIILMSVALIMGLRFPGYVMQQNIHDLCVLDSGHEKYQIWVEDAYRERYNRIYYWELVNVEEFLYEGAFPKFQEIGPYIYKETQEKIAVDFKYTTSHVVEFYEWKKQEYDGSQTRAECGEHCTEADQITILNEHYFQQMAELGSDENLSWHHLPVALKDCMRALATVATNALLVYSILGTLRPGDVEVLNSPACQNFLTFGQWLRLNDTSTKAHILQVRGNQDLYAVEMSGLYGALLSETLLGSAKATFRDANLANFCDTHMGSYELPALNMGYEVYFDPLLGLFLKDDVVIECGLIHWLQKYRQLVLVDDANHNHMHESQSELVYIIQQYLCLNATMCCVNITHQGHQPWHSTYISTIIDYIYEHLLPFAFHKSVISTNTDIIITRKQRDLALGYFYAVNSSDSLYVDEELSEPPLQTPVVRTDLEEEDITKEYEEGTESVNEEDDKSEDESIKEKWIVDSKEEYMDIEYLEDLLDAGEAVVVQGILEDVCCEENVPQLSKHVSLLTCYDQINAQSNFKWQAYQKQTHASTDQFPNASKSARRVNGWRENYPPLLSVKACSSPHLSRDNASFFLPQFWRNIFFTKSTQCGCRINGVRVNTLLFNESNLHADGEFVFEEGLQEMTGTHGYLSWISLPHYLFANESFTTQYDMQPNPSLHLPNVSIEPITGNVWGQSIKFQQSVGILPAYIQMPRRFQGLVINATGVPLPVYWMEQAFVFNQAGTDDHHERISKLMSASCGGLISITIIASLVICLGLLIACLKFRSNRVEPEPTEPETSNFYGSVRLK